MCVVQEDGLTVLRPCTGAPGERVERPRAETKNCWVAVDGLEIIRPCSGKPNERPVPPRKAGRVASNTCEYTEHDVEGDIVRLGPCPER